MGAKIQTVNRLNNITPPEAAIAGAAVVLGQVERITLPLPPHPGVEARFERDVYARFMRHLRQVPNSRLETKILAAIQFTADMMDTGDALVAKTLVDMGLRAPRRAFPVAFLDFADRAMLRSSWEHGLPPASVMGLNHHWERIGEDRFNALRRQDLFSYDPASYGRA